jgi:hypothetical protein
LQFNRIKITLSFPHTTLHALQRLANRSACGAQAGIQAKLLFIEQYILQPIINFNHDRIPACAGMTKQDKKNEKIHQQDRRYPYRKLKWLCACT